MTTTPTASPELLDLDRLEALARAATPGPWLHRHDPGNPPGVQHGVKLSGELGTWVGDFLDNADRVTEGGGAGERNAAFVAAANPEQVLALIALARRAQPEGEAPCDCCADIRAAEAIHGDGPEGEAPQADAPAPSAAVIDDVVDNLREYASNAGYSHNDYQNTMRQAANTIEALRAQLYHWGPGFAAQSQGAQAARLSIGFANNGHGVHVSVMQQHADGSATVLHAGKVPGGDSFARFTLATKDEAPSHETIVHQAGELVCTACGTSAQQAAVSGALDADELARLRRLMRALGMADDGGNDAYVRGILFTVLGQAASRIERTPSAPGTPEAPADDGEKEFARGVIAALGVLTPHGYTHGSVLHDEIVSTIGAKIIYRHAEDEDYAWAGLNPRKKPLKLAAQLDGGQEGSESNG